MHFTAVFFFRLNFDCMKRIGATAIYQQMLLDEESAKYPTINIHLGLYQYNRLPFGVDSALAIFQRAMDQILQGILGVLCYIDDILVLPVAPILQ